MNKHSQPITTVTLSDITDVSLIATNLVYCSVVDFQRWIQQGKYIRLLGKNPHFCYVFMASEMAKPGELLMNQTQRLDLFASKGEVVGFEILSFAPEATLMSLSVEFKIKKPRTSAVMVSSFEFVQVLKVTFNNQPFALGQKFQVKFDSVVYFCTVMSMANYNELIQENGLITSVSAIELTSKSNDLTFVGIANSSFSSKQAPVSPIKDIPLQELGVGGLDQEFIAIFRRAFSSRCLNPETALKWGIPHTKGILLYGPPGTGKSLMAKTIAKMLNSTNVKKLTGSDILSKWVGEAERQIRELFQPAELEWQKSGIYSSLHVIIIDEIDCICKQRASSQSTGGDSIVNQLLGKMEGLDDVSNFLVIGMTNRKDLIDSALLRPGRFEVQIEIGLPNESGRLEILNIHAKNLIENQKLASDIQLQEYAKKTKNFSGAELAGLVRAANSFALLRSLKRENEQYLIDENEVKILKSDFEASFNDVTPAFGIDKNQFNDFLPDFGFLEFSTPYAELVKSGNSAIQKFFASSVLRLSALLITGEPGTGKTTYAAHLAMQSQVAHIKIITAQEFIGKSEDTVTTKIAAIFNDCYKAPSTVLIIDGFERIISYSPVGQRYSNSILQAFLFYCSKQPPLGKKLFIISTSSTSLEALSMLGVMSLFSKSFQLPFVKDNISIKVALEEIEANRSEYDEKAFQQYVLTQYGNPFLPLVKYQTNATL